MRQYQYGAILAAALFAAACASAPEDAVDDGQRAMTATDAVSSGGTVSAEAVVSPIAASGATAGASAEEGERVSPDLVVDVNKQPPTTDSEVICRQMLKPGSNVIVNVCGTRPEWKRYDRQEALVAQELLIRMQNGRFR